MLSLAALVIVAVILIGRGRHMILIDGVLQTGFEKSDFYVRADCSRKPWWFDRSETEQASVQQLREKWDSLGRPAAIHIRFVGNVSRLGMYGHLGHYRREVFPVRILEISESKGCISNDARSATQGRLAHSASGE